MTENKAKAVLDTKLKQLLITRKRTENVVSSNKDTAIKRQLEALKALTSEVETARREVEAIKIEKGEGDGD
mgnify:FL=1